MEELIDLIKIEEGQGLVEYSLIISLIILAVIGALQIFGEGVLDFFNYIETNMP